MNQAVIQQSFVHPPQKRHGESEWRSVALYDEVGNIASQLLVVPGWEQVRIFNFKKMSDLFRIALRNRIDFILICVDGDLEEAVNLIEQADKHMSLSIIPAVIYHRRPTREQIRAGLSSAADDFIWGEWDGELFALKVKMITTRSRRDMAINPTSRLPGPVIIEQEVNSRLQAQEKFAVCYLDIDDFKAYNDHRGYFYGDRVLRLVAHIIRDVVSDLSPDSFVGHIGGDDFLFLLPVEMVDSVCANIIKAFDAIIPYRYHEDDRERGQIITTGRGGRKKTFGLMTISIAVLIANNSFTHLGQMSHMLADLKSYTKSLAGSNYIIERRERY
ncbi:MAG: diguanylate cyclase [candidate division Zixibacteria bacterium]|nr:diguanylate cyclase [candidate division Zixibacteria bacterium]